MEPIVLDFDIDLKELSKSDRGFPPAIMYTLGLGVPPTNSHAAFLQRMYHTFPDKIYNKTMLQEWIKLTGNPPLLHIPILADSFDCVYVLVNELKVTLDEVDAMGVTALHLAAWQGNANLVAFLMHSGAMPTNVDSNGRTPLHYAAIRGHGEVIKYLLKTSDSTPPKKAENLKKQLLAIKDHDGRTALTLAALTPSINPGCIRALRTEMTKLKSLPTDRWNRAPLFTERVDRPEKEPGDGEDMRGGWYYPLSSSLKEKKKKKESKDTTSTTKTKAKADKKSQNDDGGGGGDGSGDGGGSDERSDIDIVKVSSLTKSSFVRDYFSTQRPVLITDGAFNGQSVWAYWQKAAMVHKYGDLPLEFGESLHSALPAGVPSNLDPPRNTTLREWVEETMSKSNEMFVPGESQTPPPFPWVAHQMLSNRDDLNPAHAKSAQEVGKLLSQDVKRPGILNICLPLPKDNEPLQLTLGPAGSGVPVKARQNAWDLLLVGRKRWYFISPPHIFNATELPARVAGRIHVKSTAEWLRDHAPKLKKKGLIAEVTQYPGDVVFIPHGWVHATLNLVDSVSITQEFCTLKNTNQRMQPLGYTIYGGVDRYRGYGAINTLVQKNVDVRQFIHQKQRHAVPNLKFSL